MAEPASEAAASGATAASVNEGAPAVAEDVAKVAEDAATSVEDAPTVAEDAVAAVEEAAAVTEDAAAAVEEAAAVAEDAAAVEVASIEAASVEVPAPTPTLPAMNLRVPEFYLNRELTWLSFNSRVLNEAQDKRIPLLERLKFLAIASSNLDEFFMKRIGGLKQQLAANVHQLTVDGRTPQEQISECTAAVKELQLRMREVYLDLIKSLARKEIVVADYEELTTEQKDAVRDHYLKNILPLVTPLAMDPAHPFPFISNLSLSLLVTLRYRDDEEPIMNRIKVPLGSGVPRFLRIEDSDHFIPLEEVMAHNLDLLFPEMEVESCEFFRVTRNANTELEEDQAEDLLSMIETELRDRKFAPFVRLEISAGMGRCTAACWPPNWGSTRAPTSSNSTYFWACAT